MVPYKFFLKFYLCCNFLYEHSPPCLKNDEESNLTCSDFVGCGEPDRDEVNGDSAFSGCYLRKEEESSICLSCFVSEKMRSYILLLVV